MGNNTSVKSIQLPNTFYCHVAKQANQSTSPIHYNHPKMVPNNLKTTSNKPFAMYIYKFDNIEDVSLHHILPKPPPNVNIVLSIATGKMTIKFPNHT